MSHGIRTFALVDAVGQVGGADLEAFALLLHRTTRGIFVGAFWGHGISGLKWCGIKTAEKSCARLVAQQKFPKLGIPAWGLAHRVRARDDSPATSHSSVQSSNVKQHPVQCMQTQETKEKGKKKTGEKRAMRSATCSVV